MIRRQWRRLRLDIGGLVRLGGGGCVVGDSGTWAAVFADVVARVDEEKRGLSLAERPRAFRAAYPAGPRKHWPYKVWCRLVREAVHGRRDVTAAKRQDEAATLFVGM